MNMKIKNLGQKAHCLLLAGVVCAGFAACSDDNEPKGEGDNPGIITAVSNTALTSYSMTGAVLLPINVENPDIEPDPDKFTYDNFSMTEELILDDTTEPKTNKKLPVVTAVEKGEDGNSVLVFDYDHAGYAHCNISFTLGYRGTATAIPVSIDITDCLRGLDVSHLGAGLSGLLTFETNPESGEEVSYRFVDLKGIGAHTDNLSLKPQDNEYAVALDEMFEFSSEEMAQGYASIPVQAEWQSKDGSEFRTYDTFTVCPSRIMAPVTIDSENIKFEWEVKEEAESLGMDEYEKGYISLKNRDYTFYFSTKDGCLNPKKDYGYMIFPGIGSKQVSEGEHLPIIVLRGTKNLPAGEYVLVLHIKKLANNPDDKQYVDFRMPFIKE